MNFNILSNKITKLGYTLYKEDWKDFDGEYKYKVAKNYTQYTGGNNTPLRFRTLEEIENHFELGLLQLYKY